MKKAKILLSAAGILSVIAGAFAFKAQHKFTGSLFCTTAYGVNPTATTRYTITNAVGATKFCTTSTTLPATTTFKVTVNA